MDLPMDQKEVDLTKYFTQTEYAAMCDLERRRNCNLVSNYRALLAMGKFVYLFII